MQKRRSFLIATMVLATCWLQAQPAPHAGLQRNDAGVTSVSGVSWLVHLNRSFGDTSMGKTGHLGPSPEQDAATSWPSELPIHSATETVSLHGGDLYRLNCQGCHGESGAGAPPEINSLINPVRATSVTLVMARMKNSGMDISHADAAKLAQQASLPS